MRLDQQLLLDDLDLFLGVFLTVFLQVVDDLLAPAVLEYLFDHLRVLVELLEPAVEQYDCL